LTTGNLSGLGHTVAIALAGTGTGKVTGAGGISCPGTCSRVYPAGTTGNVTLTAASDPGSTFTGWSGGGCSGTATCVVSPASDQNVTATFTKNQSPPPPPAPTCTLSALSSKVLLRKPKHGHPAIGPGLLAFKATCDQNASLSLKATLTESFKRHGKKHTKRFALGPSTGSATANVGAQLLLKLPRTALTALGQKAHESVAATLTATNPNGTATRTASLAKLLGKR
jgi:hypothetical protein